MNDNQLNEALQIFRFLLDHGGKMQSADNPALYTAFQVPEVRDILRSFEEQLDVTFLNAGGTIYLIPQMGNTTFGMSARQFREDISLSTRSLEALTIAYIEMYICWEFYGGKNADPTTRTFIRLNDLLNDVNSMFDSLSKEQTKLQETDTSKEMNFEAVVQYWNSKITRVDNALMTKEGTVRKALNQFVKNGLLVQVDDTWRPTKAFHDKFVYYYLSQDRVKEINAVFDGCAGGSHDEDQ